MNIQDMEDTLNRYQNYLQQDPDNLHLLLSIGLIQAKILHHQQQLTEAINVLETLSKKHPPHADILGFLALLHFDNNSLTDAQSLTEQALKINPEQYEGQLTRILLQNFRQEADIDDIKTLLITHVDDCRLWFASACTHMRLMNILAAEQAFAKACNIWPEFYDSWTGLGWCYLLQNKLALAEDAYQKAIDINTDIADAWGGIALIYAVQQQTDNAHIYLRNAQLFAEDCFLAKVARIILDAQRDPKQVADALQHAFPDVTNDIKKILAHLLLIHQTDERVLH
jgi:tetratricopeptide (TPR) repeat protein